MAIMKRVHESTLHWVVPSRSFSSSDRVFPIWTLMDLPVRKFFTKIGRLLKPFLNISNRIPYHGLSFCHVKNRSKNLFLPSNRSVHI